VRISAAILALAILLASAPGWYWMLRQVDPGRAAQAECVSLAESYNNTLGGAATYLSGEYATCMAGRIRGGAR
jgi:hypothetical protein